MNVTIAFGSKVAIPVRALPFVASLMATPRDIARGLAEQNEKSEFVAYWADGGGEIPPQQWRPICDAIEVLTAAFLDSGDSVEESRRVEVHESVSHLPAGAFVWADTFKHWLNTKCPTKDQVRKEEYLVIAQNEDLALPLAAQRPDHSIDSSPYVPLDIQTVVMEGFEAGEYAEMLATNRIGVDDFLCLVGLNGLVDDGMYNITQGGVRASAEGWDLYAPGIRLENRREIKAFIGAAKLDFPCTPQRLVEWANGVNWDFELPIRFVRAVEEGVSSSANNRQPSPIFQEDEKEIAVYSSALKIPSSTPNGQQSSPALIPLVEPAWTLKKLERVRDMLAPMIYAALKEAHSAGEPCPTAREVMERIEHKRPREFLGIAGDDIKFLDVNGDSDTANIEAVRSRIRRLTGR
jgi:hypothetical protein